MATTLGFYNPLRYRGYVYDPETELYYLQSRYYNPEMGRFINADGFASTGQDIIGNNMFAYCGNNPISYSDYSGMRYCAATTVQSETSKDRQYACQHQNQISYLKNPRDVTAEVNAALALATLDAVGYNAVSHTLMPATPLATAATYVRFYKLVDHNAPWDIKISDNWEKTIGTPFPGVGTYVSLNGMRMTPEAIGNYTYGYLGFMYGIPLEHLLGGSYYAAGMPKEGVLLHNELWDWNYIYLGYMQATGILRPIVI